MSTTKESEVLGMHSPLVMRYLIIHKKGLTLALPETGNQYFYVYTDTIKSQYHGDAVVPVLRNVTVKREHGSYVSKNFERSHYVPLNKKVFDTISVNIRDEGGDFNSCF